MISEILNSTPLQTFIAGFAIGGMCFGGTLGVLGWCIGYEAAMRTVTGWMRKPGDLPPSRDRRFSSVQHREWLS